MKILETKELKVTSNNTKYYIYYNVRQRKAASFPIWEAEKCDVFIFEDWLKMINTFWKVIEGNLSISFLSIDKWLQLKFVNSFFTSED